MKFKTLIKTITKLVENAGEASVGDGLYSDPRAPQGQSPLTDKGTFNLALPRQIDAINAMLYTFSCRDYINPEAILGVVQQKLNLVGLDFAYPKTQIPDGLSTFELVQYGSTQLGVYGQNPYDDVNKAGFKQGDGIKEKLGHSLALTVNITLQPNHLRKVSLVIVPTATSSYNLDLDKHDCGCKH